MNKKLIAFALIGAMAFTGCQTSKKADEDKVENKTELSVEKKQNEVKESTLNQYDIEFEFSKKEASYLAKQNISYINSEKNNLKEIYFHIYPKAFEKEETAPYLFDSSSSAFPNGFQPGKFDIEELKVKGVETKYEISGETNTILKINLKEELKPNERIDIEFKYSVKMPPAEDRFGAGEKSFNFGNWYPIAAVYDETGWNLDKYYKVGDPFYSDISNYNVKVTVPKEIKVASTGNFISEKASGEKMVYEIQEKKVRDFALVLSEHFKIKEEKIDGIKVKSYFLGNNQKVNEEAHKIAVNSIKHFNKVFGKYPYDNYSVVSTSFPSGMEYPGIVFISDEYYNQGGQWLETVIVHETGHQWWYSAVGNDEIDESWLDESLTTYSEGVYIEEQYGKEAAKSYKDYRLIKYEDMSKEEKDGVVLKSLSEFKDWGDYGFLVYTKGASFLAEIEEKYGQDKLYEIFKTYYAEYIYKNATTDDFKRVCEEVLGESIDDLFEKWIY